jgi:hypothetical protein
MRFVAIALNRFNAADDVGDLLIRRVNFVHEASFMGSGEPLMRCGELIQEPPMFMAHRCLDAAYPR